MFEDLGDLETPSLFETVSEKDMKLMFRQYRNEILNSKRRRLEDQGIWESGEWHFEDAT
jgi:hypothetical protein